MRGLITALQFLTIIPLSRKRECSEKELVRSMAWYPLAGLIIGICLAAVHCVCRLVFPPMVTDVMVIVVLVVITGALHLDGFADTVDGLAGGSDRTRVLAIMKDSKIGSFAVTGICLLIVLKICALGAVPGAAKIQALIVMPVVSRWSLVALAACFPYARGEGGTGALFVSRVGGFEMVVSSMTVLLIVMGCFLLEGLVIWMVAAVITGFVGLCFRRRIGGVTGDIMGAVNEVNEVAVLLVAVAILS